MILEFQTKRECLRYVLNYFDFVGRKLFKMRNGTTYYSFNNKEYTPSELLMYLIKMNVVVLVMKQDLVELTYLRPRTRIKAYQINTHLLEKPLSGNGLLLTTTQASKFLNVSRQTIYRLLEE